MGEKSLNLERPRFDVSVELEYLVSQTITLHHRWSEFFAGPRAAVASKESEDPDELRGVKSLLSGLLFKFSVGKGPESEEMIVTSSLIS